MRLHVINTAIAVLFDHADGSRCLRSEHAVWIVVERAATNIPRCSRMRAASGGRCDRLAQPLTHHRLRRRFRLEQKSVARVATSSSCPFALCWTTAASSSQSRALHGTAAAGFSCPLRGSLDSRRSAMDGRIHAADPMGGRRAGNVPGAREAHGGRADSYTPHRRGYVAARMVPVCSFWE